MTMAPIRALFLLQARENLDNDAGARKYLSLRLVILPELGSPLSRPDLLLSAASCKLEVLMRKGSVAPVQHHLPASLKKSRQESQT